jgi:hypothetical protein
MDGTPIWRTRLWPLLIAWMALAMVTPITVWTVAERVPYLLVLSGVGALFTAIPLVLLVWSLIAMQRDPLTGWIGPTLILAFAGTLVPAAQPMIEAGKRLNFELHRTAYEHLVADARLGRLAGEGLKGGWLQGRREDVRYRFSPDRPGVVEFLWIHGKLFENGVRYDDTPCRPTRGLRCVVIGQPLEGFYSYFEELL